MRKRVKVLRCVRGLKCCDAWAMFRLGIWVRVGVRARIRVGAGVGLGLGLG